MMRNHVANTEGCGTCQSALKRIAIFLHRERILLLSILCSIAVVCTCDVALAKVSSFSNGVHIAAKFKSKAEGSAATLKRLHDQKEITNKEYNRAILLYDDARSAFDSWISGLQSEMEFSKAIQPPDEYKASLEDAARQSEIFIQQVKALVNKDATHREVIDIAKVVDTFVDAGIEIWKELRTGDRQKRESLIKRLDSVRWKSFHDATD